MPPPNMMLRRQPRNPASSRRISARSVMSGAITATPRSFSRFRGDRFLGETIVGAMHARLHENTMRHAGRLQHRKVRSRRCLRRRIAPSRFERIARRKTQYMRVGIDGARRNFVAGGTADFRVRPRAKRRGRCCEVFCVRHLSRTDYELGLSVFPLVSRMDHATRKTSA